MQRTRTPEIGILYDTGYRLAPGDVEVRAGDGPDPIPDGHVQTGVRLVADGKTYIWATVPAGRETGIEWALAWSTRIWSYIDEPTFRSHAAAIGLSDAAADAVLASVRIHDDAFFRRPPRLEITMERILQRDPSH